MPSMYEIYEKHSKEYDELVGCEDYQNNLKKELDKIIVDKESALELGAGTGRVTKIYSAKVNKIICCDRSSHMLEKAKQNLNMFNKKISFKCLDTRDIEEIKGVYDLIIQGWAVGHTVIDEFSTLNEFLEKLFRNMRNKLSKNGIIVFIESMGTNVSKPTEPCPQLKDYYSLIEKKYKMAKKIIRTDYKFTSIEEAKRIMSFFFGEEIKGTINSKIIKEYTGIWTANRW